MQVSNTDGAWRRTRPDTHADDRNWPDPHGAPLYVLLDLPVAALGNGTYPRAGRSHQPHAGRRTRCTMVAVTSALRRAGTNQTQEMAQFSRVALRAAGITHIRARRNSRPCDRGARSLVEIEAVIKAIQPLGPARQPRSTLPDPGPGGSFADEAGLASPQFF